MTVRIASSVCESVREGNISWDAESHSSCADEGHLIPCRSIVIATGTFLGGEIHVGMDVSSFGRINEPASHSLSHSLREAGFALSRLKTGTPPRLHRDSIRFEGMAKQVGDVPAQPFSFLTHKVTNEDNQVNCFQTATNTRTHDVVRANLDKSIHIRETVKGPLVFFHDLNTCSLAGQGPGIALRSSRK